MIADDLMGLFGFTLTDAAQNNRYLKREDGSIRPIGGYNTLFFGDMLQIPPIPPTAALFLPPCAKKSEAAKDALALFWSDSPDALNFFIELTEQWRIDDEWYQAFLSQCRVGELSEEMYNFFMGIPTQHAGSWVPQTDSNKAEKTLCGNPACAKLPHVWQSMANSGSRQWSELHTLECSTCAQHRENRNRHIKPNDPRVHQEPFLQAPYVHQNNEPKYHAMLLRSVEQAKHCYSPPRHILWITAQDTPQNPKEICENITAMRNKLDRFLQSRSENFRYSWPLSFI